MMKSTSKKVKQDLSVVIARNVIRGFLVLWSITIIIPIVWTLMTSLKSNGEILKDAWSLPAKLQWVNYKIAWEEANFSKYFGNSLLLSVGTVALTLLLTTTTSYVVAKFVHPLINGIGKFYALFMMVPQVLLLIPLYKLCQRWQLTNGSTVFLTLMITNALQGMPFYVFLMTPFIKGLNNSIFEAAEIDGANQFQAFFRLVIPMSLPAIFMVCLLSFVGIWNEYGMSITFIQESAYFTVSVGIQDIMNNSKEFTDNVKFAALMLAMIPILIVYIIFQKPLQNGLSSSDGVKG